MGGKYDGVFGVLGGFEVICIMNDFGIKIKYLIVVINWINEEGMCFVFVMLVFGVFVGKYMQDWVYDCVDVDGKWFGDELVCIGWVGDEEVGVCKMYVMFELYIE